jgi:ribosomal protein S27E
MGLGYWLYVECKKCGHEIAFKEIPRPSPDDDLRSRSVHLTCPSCAFDTAYRPPEIHFGIMESDDEQAGP